MHSRTRVSLPSRPSTPFACNFLPTLYSGNVLCLRNRSEVISRALPKPLAVPGALFCTPSHPFSSEHPRRGLLGEVLGCL